jgi:hypothetical protein
LKEDKVDIRQRQKVPLYLQEVSSNLIKELLKRDTMVIGKTPRTTAGRSSRDIVHTAVCRVIEQLLVGLRNNNSLEYKCYLCNKTGHCKELS